MQTAQGLKAGWRTTLSNGLCPPLAAGTFGAEEISKEQQGSDLFGPDNKGNCHRTEAVSRLAEQGRKNC